MQIDPMHAARLANLEGALCALLREARDAYALDPNTQGPDGVTATLHSDGLEIEYTLGGLPVGGEGV